MIYEVTYKALSPLHIGYRQIGILKTTRYYITGKAIWGAITAILTRHLFDAPESEEYRKIGEFVRKNIRATYFFPVTGNEVYFPNYDSENERIGYGRLTKSQFESTFVYSYVSTALDLTRTAEENTLHEVEYIKHEVETENGLEDVLWKGFLFVRENEDNDTKIVTKNDDFSVECETEGLINASDFLKRLEVGGERNYGFGKLVLVESMKKASQVFGCDTKDCTIRSNIAHGHVSYTNIEYCGDIEPLVGREWAERGPGRKTVYTHENRQTVFFVPGTSFGSQINFKISDYGTWRIT